jgi:hypothetical protein
MSQAPSNCISCLFIFGLQLVRMPCLSSTNSMEQSLLEKLITTWEVTKFPSRSYTFPSFYRTQRFIAMSQEPTVGPHPEPDESTPHYFFRIYFHIIASSTPRFTREPLPIRLSDKNFVLPTSPTASGGSRIGTMELQHPST